jgi:hypothetical protein
MEAQAKGRNVCPRQESNIAALVVPSAAYALQCLYKSDMQLLRYLLVHQPDFVNKVLIEGGES